MSDTLVYVNVPVCSAVCHVALSHSHSLTNIINDTEGEDRAELPEQDRYPSDGYEVLRHQKQF